MCHDVNARPPEPPYVTSEVGSRGGGELTASDGNRFRVYHAEPVTPNGSSVLLLPDFRGLHPFYEALAGHFAATGFHTLAMDWYGRTAGTGDRDADFDGRHHMGLLAADHADTDIDAAVARLRMQNDGPVFTVGFCLGGAHSWRQAARDVELAAAVGFYGPAALFEADAADVTTPVLMLLAGDDAASSPADFARVKAKLEGKPYQAHTYEGAPHSFFDRDAANWRQACDDAWHRLLDFIAQHS